MKKRILIFSLAYYPKVGGAEVAIKNITDRISPEDIEFEMVTLRFQPDSLKKEQVGNVLVHRIGSGTFLWKRFFQIAAYLYAKKLHTVKSFDVVWGMMAHSGGIPASLFKRRFPNVKYVLTLQEGDPLSQIKRQMLFVWPLFVQVFRRADQVQAISSYLARWARQMGYRGEPIVIPNGGDVEKFKSRERKVETGETSRRLGVKDEDILLVTTSRLVPKNGISDVIDALQFLPEQFKFLIVGTGPLESNLKLQVSNRQLQGRVFFVGHISHENLPQYLTASDIFIRPSLSEGMGNSFIEAMAAGLPVIATQEGGIADFLFDPDRNKDREPTGFAVGVHDPKGIAAQCERIVSDSELRDQVVKNAQLLVTQKYDWNTITRDMEGLFINKK